MAVEYRMIREGDATLLLIGSFFLASYGLILRNIHVNINQSINKLIVGEGLIT